jgi:class 3 adenylate cyclase/tetratricopeptide (TPR) repeat protein
MKCPKCQFDGPESAKFCGECGAKLEMACPQCGTMNPPGGKFCFDCGHNLSVLAASPPIDLSFDEKIAKIRKYLPKGITEKILSQRDKIEGERKQVTVMFCDMKGFTPLSEKLGPEAVYSLMDQVYEILLRKVHDYEGTVNKMTGDGIMALFGAPIALENAPQRAIQSAIAIHREMPRFNERVKKETGDLPPVKMRIGIHTGPVVVGTLGNDLRIEFTAVGDTVNLASRMESLAEPGTTYVTGDTFQLTEGFFRFEALGEKEIKGKEKPVKVYQVIAPSTRRTRFDVSAERGLAPFVGRERERELLLDGFERSREGRGQAVSIVSDAGIGKSRLLYEFRKAVTNEEVVFLEGRCLSYSRHVAYHPIVEILRANFDVQDHDAAPEIRKKVARGLQVMRVDEASTLPYLLELLSVKDSGIDKIPMSPEARKDRTLEALKRIVLKGSELRPLIMAIEDLHWIDRSSEDVLKELLGSISAARVFLVFTYRPEFVHTWGSRSYHSQVTLNRLSSRESLELAAHVLGTKEMEKALEELILEKTEGVPFFIEEFIKSLKDLKLIEQKDDAFRLSKEIGQLTIPSTIQDVIMARVDSLPERAKEVLQAGSVIEREFPHELIERIMGLPEKELLSNLSFLKDAELLYERGIYPQSIYIFKHALTREVVYDSILAKRKNTLHEQIGNAIEELCRENLSEQFEALAAHYLSAEIYSKAAEYSRLASRKADKAVSLNDAIAHARKRVTSLERLPRTADVEKKIIDARVVLGLYLAQMSFNAEAKEVVDQIIDLAIKHDYKKRICQIYTIIGTYYCFVEENYPNGFKVLEEALNISEETKDLVASLLANFWFGYALGWNCEFEKALKRFQKVLDIQLATNNLYGISALKSNIAIYSYYYAGNINLGFRTSVEAIRTAEESGDILSKVMAYISHGISCYGKGFLEEAEKHLLKGLEFCERINNPGWNSFAHFNLGEIYFDLGNFAKSQTHFEKGILELENTRAYPSWASLFKVGLARSEVMNKGKDVDLEFLPVHFRNNKVKVIEGWIQRYIGEIFLNVDDRHLSEAEQWIHGAIEADRRNGMMLNLGRDHALCAELFKRKGDRSKFQEHLGKAIDLYKDCGADGWRKKSEERLAMLSNNLPL